MKLGPDNPKKVIIVGGGVAGLTAAHELVERGFEVVVYEMKDTPGGKARSMYIPDSSTPGRSSLPAEHGFRFFPGFYQHIFDTMRRIPFGDNPKGVYSNLIPIDYMVGSTNYSDLFKIPLNFPKSRREAVQIMRLIKDLEPIGIPASELEFYITKVWQLWTSSKVRRLHEYENISWWDFIEAEEKSRQYQVALAKGQTTQLVACRPEVASTKTIGEIGFKIMMNTLSPKSSPDLVLNGPTNEVWIQPWVDHIRNLGGKYRLRTQLVNINLTRSRITSLTLRDLKTGDEFEDFGDYYILALPVEVLNKFITPKLITAAPELGGIPKLCNSTQWMNGIMFYLNRQLNLEPSHISLFDSPWSLTAIAQAKTWHNFKFEDVGSGEVRDILSVVISDWNTPGQILNKPAKECTPQQIKQEVWYQLKIGLNKGVDLIDDDNLVTWYLDPDIYYPKDNPSKSVNLEPLLVNQVGTWELRPNNNTGIKNLLIAGDFTRTETDLATMESANESARRAVNHIVNKSQRVRLFKWGRPSYLMPLIWYDAWRYKRGLPWKSAPSPLTILYRLSKILSRRIKS